ncbi:MAG: hypothetical protein ACI4OR_03770, partial [Alphaproteobacteria bacterium]
KVRTVICALALMLGLSTPVMAEPCANGAGTVINGADGKTTYCKSNIAMNWWSALAWCDAAGMSLISLEECNGKDGAFAGTGESNCPNLAGVAGNNWVWTTSVSSANSAYCVVLSSGAVNYSVRNYSFSYALCK